MTDHSQQIVEYCAQDNTRASAHVFSADDPGAPVLILLPAMGVRGSFYKDFAQTLNGSGFHVVISDLRGIGSSSVRASRNCDFGYEEIISIDTPALLEAVRKCFPSNDKILVGHSLGGQLGALCLSAYPDSAKALVLIAACNVYYKGWSGLRRWRVLGIAMLLRAMGAMLGYVPAKKIGFAGNEARTLVVDWSNNCFTGRYVIANSNHDYEDSLRRMAKPVLAISFELDQLAPRKSVENFLNKLTASSVARRHFATDDEALEKANHFDWAKRPQAVAETIRCWADETLSVRAARIDERDHQKNVNVD